MIGLAVYHGAAQLPPPQIEAARSFQEPCMMYYTRACSPDRIELCVDGHDTSA